MTDSLHLITGAHAFVLSGGRNAATGGAQPHLHSSNANDKVGYNYF
jgi:hypothetical protein